MKQKDYTLKKMTMRGMLTLFLSSLMTFAYAQDPCPDAPVFETVQYFCSESAWAKIGEDADYLGDLPIYAEDSDYVLTWYRDSDLNDEVIDPKSELLVDGDTFYVTQTDADDCESNALEIIVSEKDCGCVKDAAFEDQNGNPSARGYEFYQFDGISNHKTCGQSMFGANPIQLGAVDGYTGQDDVALVTQGFDPTHINSAGNPTITLPNHPRTNPDNPRSTHALRINRGAEYGGPDGKTNITSMSKDFIAGEVFAFSFSMILQNPNHSYEQQPFGQVNLYDENDNLIQTRCLVSDPDDCIFNKAGSGTGEVLYSNWSCMKLSTADFIGQHLRAEFITAFCTPTQHYSFMYVDDLYAGDDGDDICGELAFGYAVVNSVSPASEGTCYIPALVEEIQGCVVDGQSANIPGFPIYVCGEYDAPISQGNPPSLADLTLEILQDNAVVGTIANAQPGTSPNTFCFLIEESDVQVLPYGEFTFKVDADFTLDCGNEYHFLISDRSKYDMCPTAGCPDLLQVCDLTGDGFTKFNLTEHGDIFYGTQWDENDVDMTYYLTEEDAHDTQNEINDPESFQNTIAHNQTIYIRMEWDIEGVDSCYYLMPLDLEVTHIPVLEAWDEEIIFCDNEEIDYPLVATPENVEDLINIHYKWYKDGKQLPYSGTIYRATEPGEYTVVVSEENCEVEQTIKISQVALEVSLPYSDIEICDEDSFTIVPTVTSVGETEVDLDEVEYLWNTGDTTKELTVTKSGTYSLEVSVGDCIYYESMEVLMVVRPELSGLVDLTLCRDTQEIVTLDITHPNVSGLHIQWFRDGGLIAEDVTELEVSEAGIYKVLAGDALADDCHEEITFTVEYYNNENCIIPEGLSPNNDGINDNLDLEFLNDKSGIASLKIYNRHGLEVYSKDNYVNEWHGQSKNDKILPVGAYFYVITLKDGSDQITGNIYLNY